MLYAALSSSLLEQYPECTIDNRPSLLRPEEIAVDPDISFFSCIHPSLIPERPFSLCCPTRPICASTAGESTVYSMATGKPRLLLLPPETLEHIFGYVSCFIAFFPCSSFCMLHTIISCYHYLHVRMQCYQATPKDLLSLSLVCRLFHQLATSLLYRNIRHVLPVGSGSDRTDRLEIDRLAAVLETLTTSDYNYARFVREISIYSTSAAVSSGISALRGDGGNNEPDYARGRLFSSLLLAVLKKATVLETFRCVLCGFPV